MRRAPQKASALESLATRLGRKPVNRGKEPMWESADFPFLKPQAIPHHGGRDVSPLVRKHVLDQLQEDIFAWDNLLSEEDEDGNEISEESE